MHSSIKFYTGLGFIIALVGAGAKADDLQVLNKTKEEIMVEIKAEGSPGEALPKLDKVKSNLP